MLYTIKPLFKASSDDNTCISTNSLDVAKHYLENGIAIDVGGKTEIVSAVVYANNAMVSKDDNTYVVTFFNDNESVFSPHANIALQCATL